MKKFHIKKGDQVKVISGNHKGKQGQVLEVIGDKDRALVESVNIVKRHTKPSAQFPEGGIIEKEGSIHISNLMKVDPKTGEPTRSAKAKTEVKKTEVKKAPAKKTEAKKVTKTTKKVKEVSK